MVTTVEAVYEHGVLRLIQPLLLPEGTHVEVTVTPKAPAPATRTPAEILAAIAAKPWPAVDGETASRDHDASLYVDSKHA